MPRSKHYPFSIVENVSFADVEKQVLESEDAGIVAAYLSLAQLELGVESALARLLQKRTAVHTSALVDAERLASEDGISAFNRDDDDRDRDAGARAEPSGISPSGDVESARYAPAPPAPCHPCS